jgi:hypothetical protein
MNLANMMSEAFLEYQNKITAMLFVLPKWNFTQFTGPKLHAQEFLKLLEAKEEIDWFRAFMDTKMFVSYWAERHKAETSRRK